MSERRTKDIQLPTSKEVDSMQSITTLIFALLIRRHIILGSMKMKKRILYRTPLHPLTEPENALATIVKVETIHPDVPDPSPVLRMAFQKEGKRRSLREIGDDYCV